MRELPGAEICGIVQRPVSNLTREQRILASGSLDAPGLEIGPGPRIRSWARRSILALLDSALWFLHGCPPKLNASPAFTADSLEEKCAEFSWPFLLANDLDAQSVAHFAACVAPDLVIALGEVPSLPATALVPSRGWIRARSNDVFGGAAKAATGLHVRVEHLSDYSAPPQELAGITLPRQVYDSPVGFTLKSDLVVDDLLTQAVVGIQTGTVSQTSAGLIHWIQNLLSPYLAQLGSPSATTVRPARRWLRSVWSLTVETILLCSPVVVCRNWLRRLRGRYPVLILVHHLVSDRAHRMSISTEAFWRQVLFLHRHYRIVSLSEASELLQSGRLRVPAVSLTFDDGYADNFISLRAVAEEFGISVALFITTVPIDLHREFQHDVIRGQHGAFPMTWQQIRYWKDRGAEFGSHTRTHIKCGVVDRALLREEIVGSKADFEAQLGETPRFFAFPYGTLEDMPAEATQIAASAYPHFLSAFGGENFPDRTNANSHLFRKNAYPEPWELELELQSVFDLVESAKRKLRLSGGHPPQSLSHPPASPESEPVQPSLNFDQGANLLAESSQVAQRLAKPS
ncbi:MAG TPA: polysaccharide deacetylase family protein [Candidatus Aquilonibacter sp.]|nr:polysaccharide deacetylase family protein [Candidatus Aquilonibacter sp.]